MNGTGYQMRIPEMLKKRCAMATWRKSKREKEKKTTNRKGRALSVCVTNGFTRLLISTDDQALHI